MHYLKVLCDEIFGRDNFITSIVWQKIYTTKNSAKHFSGMHDYILVIAKNGEIWRRNDLERTSKQDDAYKNPDKDPRGPWKATPIHARNYYSKGLYPITSPSGRVIEGPPHGTYWRMAKEKFLDLDADKQIWWGEKGDNTPAQKRFLSEVQGGVVPSTWWTYSDAGHNGEAKNEVRALSDGSEDLFITPKPEKLLYRILQIASNPGDLVLDSFAGSGTTGAVAQKMGRRWIMVELGDHCHTHVIPRLRRVIDGEDRGGISESVDWKGGGGFRYYKLAPSLIVSDRWGNPVINPEYNAAQLAEALAKLEGFTYAPSDLHWWQHGHSSERDFIYVTTQNLSAEQLQALSDEVGNDQSLLVCCAAFHGITAAQAAARWPNLTLKKIPKMVLARCEWGHDDYSLNVANLPMAQEDESAATSSTATRKTKKSASANAAQSGLFGENEA